MNIDTTIMAAIITGIFVITVPVIAHLMKYRIHHVTVPSKWRTIHGRKDALFGKWTGTIILLNPANKVPNKVPVKFELLSKRHTVNGNASIEYNYEQDVIFSELELVGQFYYERFLVIDYKNIISSKLQFGSCLLELNAGANALSGSFIGFATGSDNSGISSGRLYLQKINTGI